jgi:hypothetical protein
MSGKPRMAGALAGLEYFKVPDARDRVQTYADRKQALLIRLIDAGEFKAYPDALRFVLAVRAAGIPVAAASSSKNAGRFLGVDDQVIPQGCDQVIPQVWPVRGMLSGGRGPLVRDAPGSGAGSVAGPGHEQLVAVVDQSVEQGLGHDGVGEQRIPVDR